MNKFPAVIFHLVPIIPFALQYPFFGIATLLLVALAYIKVHKLRALEAEEIRKNDKADPSIAPAREFWERLTFLPPQSPE